MTRGDQRDRAREKNAKKQQAQKAKPDGALCARRERDADIMRKKQEAAADKKKKQQAGS
eukprot:NODE_5412_length_708_cov_7.169954_g4559_i0.p5 GENE.NODE_5412_length_708_cov_7.169954_g4559_i0~~NODE_5412_length_708_cov_7.169954_g4559_i0.p5  ORF type:complete len:59 (+),score=29.95 NODE_5412_length_708_cov_7.169954_g4559_i0:120-296(+)